MQRSRAAVIASLWLGFGAGPSSKRIIRHVRDQSTSVRRPYNPLKGYGDSRELSRLISRQFKLRIA